MFGLNAKLHIEHAVWLYLFAKDKRQASDPFYIAINDLKPKDKEYLDTEEFAIFLCRTSKNMYSFEKYESIWRDMIKELLAIGCSLFTNRPSTEATKTLYRFYHY